MKLEERLVQIIPNKVKSIELSSLLVRVILTVTAALMILRC